MEDGGLPVTLGLRVKDPFRHEGCTFNNPDCIVDAAMDCSKQDAVYSITCGGCLDDVVQGPNPLNMPKPEDAGGQTRVPYIGMMGTSLHNRGKSYMMSVYIKDKSNALAHHVMEVHEREK